MIDVAPFRQVTPIGASQASPGIPQREATGVRVTATLALFCNQLRSIFE